MRRENVPIVAVFVIAIIVSAGMVMFPPVELTYDISVTGSEYVTDVSTVPNDWGPKCSINGDDDKTFGVTITVPEGAEYIPSEIHITGTEGQGSCSGVVEPGEYNIEAPPGNYTAVLVAENGRVVDQFNITIRIASREKIEWT